MKYLKNQRGYAMIELILVLTTISILSSVVLPNISNSFKTAYVNYEMQNLYSEMRFIQAATRICTFNNEDVFSLATKEKYDSAKSFIIQKNDFTKNSYALSFNNNYIRQHYIASTFSFPHTLSISSNEKCNIKNFNNASFTLYLTKNSVECKPYIVVDSVGRIRFSLTKPKS